tara:strand:- start:93 stop:1457 length:1365 start_codon:yes stop_codon:yes gene_type:complete
MDKTIESVDSSSLDVPGVFRIDKKGSCPCVICLESIEEDSDMAVLKCGHRFHASCLFESAVSGNDRCALCRIKVGKKPEARPVLTVPLARIFIQHEFNQLGLGKHMDKFCKNLSPEAKEKWMNMKTNEKLEICGDMIDAFRVFGMRLSRHISTWIDDGESRMNIPEEAQMDPLTFPPWSFDVYSNEETEQENTNYDDDDDNSEYDDMPALINDEGEIVPVRLSFEEERMNDFHDHCAAIQIQRIMRGYLGRRNYTFLVYKQWLSKDVCWIDSYKITEIQAIWRGYIYRKVRNHHRMRERICKHAAIEIQRLYRGYLYRKLHINNRINMNSDSQIDIINTIVRLNNETAYRLNSISTTDAEGEMDSEDIQWENAIEMHHFLNESSLSEDIKLRIMNNEWLSNYENFMSSDIENIMWPNGGPGNRPLFTRGETDIIFGEIIRYNAENAWGTSDTID